MFACASVTTKEFDLTAILVGASSSAWLKTAELLTGLLRAAFGFLNSFPVMRSRLVSGVPWS